ncbi:PREDICTED: serine/threonine-protein kinase PRP4 homolog [Ipomoea nil]|uniref:serine/threonine-protein kinase PRP4 homolog n=1 Tax=Ipomoea nil TaxID=35883 RepID=UPI0009015A6F|nr:PREDICTED: serine/threonine-protein kinase PRP4 homolog [Ipomoea nil]
MSKLTEAKKITWSTWEELLLAFAVKRHGLKDWDSVAMELRTRTSLPDLLTAQVCREKYGDLHRRFMNSDELAVDVDAGAGAIDIPWLDKLRQLRVTELKQEVHRYDLSIQSLQLKVKRMEEERDHSLRESQNDAVKPDLKEDRKEKRSENDEKNGDGETPEKASGKSVSVTESDRENRSFNESNSTENRGTEEKAEPLSIEGGETKPDPQTKPVREEDSCNDSSDRREESNRSQDRKSENELAAETRDSVGASKESSDVQSTASLTKKRRKRADLSGGDGGNVATAAAAAASPATATKRESAVKSEPFVGLLDIIRSRKHASMFERRLDSQKTERYKSIIRRHVDFGTVQARIDDGFYSGCPMSFYLDLLLLFNNAIVFFPKSSPEWRAAHQHRDIVTKELRNYRSSTAAEQPSSAAKVEPEQPKLERPDSLLVKQKSTAPIVVCRKRSSFSAKAAGSGNKQENEKPPLNPKTAANKSSPSTPPEDDSSKKMKPNEKPVTGVRSMRRTTKGRPANASQSTNVKKSGGAPSNKPESSKMEEETSSIDKKRGAADFLKRIKKNSATKDTLVDNSSSSKRVQQKRKPGTEERRVPPPVKEAKVVENSPSKRSVGRPSKRSREAAATPPAEKRGKETNSNSKEGSSKRPQKRSRR